ncbi:MAG: SH3 beta-barrel fold-containing protein [Saprospiraceae bacterium]
MNPQTTRNNLYDKLVQLGLSRSWARRKERLVRQLEHDMLKNIVPIVFRRKDGVVVRKFATLNPAFLPREKTEVQPRPDHPEQIIFWSVRDEGYRSFLAQNLLRVEAPASIVDLITKRLSPGNTK